MASADHKYRAPEVEDYNSDQSEHPMRNKSPQANVSTKRSKDLKSDKGPILEKVATNIDGRSDSGYSSYTAASKSSADSAPSASRAQPPPPPTAAPTAAQSPAPKSRRSAGGESRQHSNESSPRQKPSRTASVSSKSRPAAGQRRPTATQGGAEERKIPLGDPNWITCGPNAEREMPQRNHRPQMPPPAMSSHNVRDSYLPSDQLSQHSDPHPYSPPSPTYTRQPAPYSTQGPAVVQTARTRRPSVARQRPQSYAGDPSFLWGQSGMPGMPAPYPSPPQEPQSHRYPQPQEPQQHRGLPPAGMYNGMQQMSNMPNIQYQAMPQWGMHQPGYPVQQPGYTYPQQPQQGFQQRPDMSARGSSSYGRLPPPVITHAGDNEPNQYSARYSRQPPTPSEPLPHSQKRLSHQQMPPVKLLQYGDEVSSDDDSEEEEDEPVIEYDAREEQRRARALMPPPKLTRAPSQRRPVLTHTKTAPAVEPVQRRESRRKSIVVNDPVPSRERQREQRVPARATADLSRRASVSRPPNHRSTQSEYVTPQARIEVNNSRSDRRQSYQAYERAQQAHAREQHARVLEERYKEEQKRQKRASKVYEQAPRHIPGQFDDDEESDEEESEEEHIPVPPVLRRRKTDATERPRKKERAPSMREVDAAEEYIMSTRGSYEPYADSVNKAARGGSRMPPVLHSESGSSHSSGRASQSNRTTMTSNTNGEVRLRLESGQAVNLQLSGDMEGRTLQLLPAENGMTDLVIGNARGGETEYHSERSSMRGSSNPNRRSTVGDPRRRERDVEVISERSRNGRSRRDRDDFIEDRDDRDHVLRRTRKIYH